MRFALRRRAILPIALAAPALCITLSARAADDHSATNCQPDALGIWYCAPDPKGSAVVDALGRIVCAPGACVKQANQDKPDKDEWLCSPVSGGRAEAVPGGPPTCEGGCRQPEATACRKK